MKTWNVPTDSPQNPELAELAATLDGDKPPSPPKLVRARTSHIERVGASESGRELVARRAVERDVRERLIRVSGHVTKEKQFVIRKAAADRNMSVDAFVIACLDAVLRSQGLIE